MSERSALIILSLPLLAFYFFFWESLPRIQRLCVRMIGALLIIYSLCFLIVFADSFLASSSRVEVRRDYAASVISADPDGNKKLLVNGLGMTTLTRSPKFMIHLPMTLHKGPPQSILSSVSEWARATVRR